MSQILVVEDDERVASFLDRGLRAEGYRVTVAGDGEQGLTLAGGGGFDLIVLDLMLPGRSGQAICRELRVRRVLTPILMLTAMDALEDRVGGLRLGADDYLTKPFDFEELLARIEALLRRSQGFGQPENRLVVGDLSLDRDRCEVRRGERTIALTAKELALLELLMGSPGKVFSRERILNGVWGYTQDPLTNVVDVYIRRLRSKIDDDGEPSLIQTLRGRGYRIVSREG